MTSQDTLEGSDSPFDVLVLDGKGGGVQSTLEEFEQNVEDGSRMLWLHLDYSHHEVTRWLENATWLNPIIKDNLQDDDTRPRYILLDDSVFLSLRGVNLNPGAEPEDMVGVRIWVTKHYVVTSNRRRLMSLEDIKSLLSKQQGPQSLHDYIKLLLERLSLRTEKALEQLEDEVAQLEEDIVIGDLSDQKKRLADVRRRAIQFKRYLAPQKEALFSFTTAPPLWLSKGEDHKIQFEEFLNTLKRHLEILDSIRDQAIVAHEEIMGKLSETLNRRMYMLSVVTAIFLPLSFITGLLGINVGGIPGGQSSYGFWFILAGIVGLAACIAASLKLMKWF